MSLAMIIDNDLDMAFAALGGLFFAFMIIALALGIFSIIIHWKLYEKAGEEGWKAIIPFYNTYIMIKIAFGEGKLWIFAVMMAIPFLILFTGDSTSIAMLLNLVQVGFGIYVSFNFYRRYASDGMAVGALFIPVIFGAIIAFGDYTYTPVNQVRNSGSNSDSSGGNPYEY